jgi:signal transduction histidine kinase
MKIRYRLALQYGLLFLVAGAVLLAVTYLLVRHNLASRLGPDTVVVYTGPASAVMPDLPGEPGALPPNLAASLRHEQAAFEAATLHSLLTGGGIALAAVGLLAAVFGWLMAGRALRPLSHITGAARRVAERNLHERIVLAGPRDELWELADTFNAMLDRLDHAFDGQRHFAAKASHELRTPLTINRTLLEVTLDRPGLPEETRQLGQTLLAVNARHERLIDGLLVLAQSENELTELAPLDLAELAGHVLDGAAATGGVSLVRDLNPAPAAGDPVLLERLVHNLVDNALRYNVPGGSVAVSTAQDAEGRAVLTVTNTGPIVPSYDVDRIFEPFRRLVDDGRTAGAGLGLSIVRAVARAHGGAVTATPRADGGLVVRLTV